MIRGERPIKLRDSWFSAKSISVESFNYFFRGRALNELGGHSVLPNSNKLRILKKILEETNYGCKDS